MDISIVICVTLFFNNQQMWNILPKQKHDEQNKIVSSDFGHLYYNYLK